MLAMSRFASEAPRLTVQTSPGACLNVICSRYRRMRAATSSAPAISVSGRISMNSSPP